MPLWNCFLSLSCIYKTFHLIPKSISKWHFSGVPAGKLYSKVFYGLFIHLIWNVECLCRTLVSKRTLHQRASLVSHSVNSGHVKQSKTKMKIYWMSEGENKCLSVAWATSVINITSVLFIHCLIAYPSRTVVGVSAYPSWHMVGRLGMPRTDHQPIMGLTQTDRQQCTLIRNQPAKWEVPINLTCISLDCRWKPKHLEKTRASAQRGPSWLAGLSTWLSSLLPVAPLTVSLRTLNDQKWSFWPDKV